jgi:hypothetical protein
MSDVSRLVCQQIYFCSATSFLSEVFDKYFNMLLIDWISKYQSYFFGLFAIFVNAELNKQKQANAPGLWIA